MPTSTASATCAPGSAPAAPSEIASALQTAAAGRSGAEALRAVATAYRAYAHAHPGTYAAMQVASDREDNQTAAAAAVGVFVAVLDGYGSPARRRSTPSGRCARRSMGL